MYQRFYLFLFYWVEDFVGYFLHCLKRPLSVIFKRFSRKSPDLPTCQSTPESDRYNSDQPIATVKNDQNIFFGLDPKGHTCRYRAIFRESFYEYFWAHTTIRLGHTNNHDNFNWIDSRIVPIVRRRASSSHRITTTELNLEPMSSSRRTVKHKNWKNI